MKKIMFDNNYGLTQAVIELRKTNTRRVCKEFRTGGIIYAKDVESIGMYSDENLVEFIMKDGSVKVSVPGYKVGEVVAVAQSYKSIHETMMSGDYGDCKYDAFRCAFVAGKKGWDNKMFVRADLMPYRIKITDIKVERLQDISDEDCLKEGIYVSDTFTKYGIRNGYSPQCTKDPKEKKWWFDSPREAFAVLIDKVSGNGTWERNPWVFAYTFELVK